MRMLTVATLAIGLISTPALAEDSATAEEIIDKVNDATNFLAEQGTAGLAAFNAADSEFVWKDSYIFVYDCAADVIAAHPVAESRGVSISALKGGRAETFGLDLCAAADKPGGSWTEYWWPRPVAVSGADHLNYSGDFIRKVSYMRQVPGTSYQVGAGMFDETTSLDMLNNMIE